MSEAPTAARSRPSARPNPFAFPSDTDFRFPSDTDFRFRLLIVSVLGAGLLLFAVVFETLPWAA